MIFFTRMEREPIMAAKAIAWANNIHWTKSAWIHNPTKYRIYPKKQNTQPEISKKRSFWEYLNPTSLRIVSCSFFVGLPKPSSSSISETPNFSICEPPVRPHGQQGPLYREDGQFLPECADSSHRTSGNHGSGILLSGLSVRN